MESVTNEVKYALGLSTEAPAVDPNAAPMRFGAKDITILAGKT